ncbi:MAG: MFS transporter, partial [Chloroflexi bacterium]|nr:MFS transporter [Chloroflexota bacterium]
ILARRFPGDRDGDLRRALSWSYVISVLGLALTAPLAGFGVVMLGNLIRAFGGGVNWVFSTQILLKALPDRLRGRIFSTEFAFFTLGNAVSAAAGGWLLDSGLGISGSLWVITVLTMIPGLLWMLWMRSHPRTVLVDAGAELTVGPLNH